MKSKPRSNQRKIKRARKWLPGLGYCLIGTAVLLAGATARGEDTETDDDDEEEPLTPEEMFEGGSTLYENWIEFSFGGMFTRGNRSQAEERHRLKQGIFGGLEDFHYQTNVTRKAAFSMDGRALFDNQDYKVGLALTHEDRGFVRFNFENFRTWYNGDGGFYHPGGLWYPLPRDTPGLDRGEVSFEAGLTLEDKPHVIFRYRHLYRDGEKASTIWGLTHPELTMPGGNPSLVRGLSPTFQDIDEQRHIFELDLLHRIKKTDVGLGLRYEAGDLNNTRKITQWPGEPVQRRITDREGATYDLFNVHAFTETWIKNNLFFSSGFSFTSVDSDFSGSRISGEDFDVGFAPNPMNSPGYLGLAGGAKKNDYVLNLNLLSMPAKTLSIVPSIRVQKEEWDANSRMRQTGATLGSLALSRSDGDLLDVRERLDIRYTGFTNWVLYARAEATQGEGNLDELQNVGATTPIRRQTEDTRFFQKYSAGARWYASPRITLDIGGYYKLNQYDYDNRLDNTANNSANRYPAYLVMQDFETYDGNVRLTLKPFRNVTMVSRYEYQQSGIRTKPDAISGLREVQSSDMTSHIFAQNISWIPWSRLYLQAGLNYVRSRTETPASRFTQAILDAENNYWTVNFNSGLVVNDKTDFNLGYFFYKSDNFVDNSVAGLPLGSHAEEHGITATLVRRLTENLRLTLRYGYFNYDELTFGQSRNHEAHVLFSTLQYRF